MTPDHESLRIKALKAKALAEKATSGPWECTEDAEDPFPASVFPRGDYIIPTEIDEDAQFIAAARTAVPELADAVIALLDENDKLRRQAYSDAMKLRWRRLNPFRHRYIVLIVGRESGQVYRLPFVTFRKRSDAEEWVAEMNAAADQRTKTERLTDYEVGEI